MIKEIIVWVAPIIAGFVVSILIPILIKKICLKYLKKKIDEINEATELKEIKEEIKEVKKEIFEMRGKRK